MIRLVLAFLLSLCVAAQAQLSGGVGGFPGPGTAHSSSSTPFSISYVSENSTVATQTTYTYSTQSIGAADSTRILTVGVSGGASNLNVTGVTVDGNAMTCPAGAIQSSTVGMVGAMCYLAWPTGTTATIAVTFAGAQGRCAIKIHNVLGSTTTFSVADGAQSATTVTSISKSVTIPNGGGAIGLVSPHAASQTITGTNLTMDGTNLTAGSSTTRTGTASGTGAAVSLGGTWGASQDVVLSILAFAP